MGLFDEQLSRKPNLYPWTDNFIKSMWHSFWTPDEFDFKADIGQFHTELSEEEKQIITKTLSAIGQIEIAVKKFWAKLGDNLPHPALSDVGHVMANSEVIHNIAYERLLTRLQITDIFEENLKVPVIKGRVDYLRKYNNKVYTDIRKQYIYSIILFTIFIENVSLFSQFYIIMWFNRYKNVLKDTAQQVSYTRIEETLHSNLGIKIINVLREEYPHLFDEELYRRIQDEIQEAYAHECKVIDWIVGDYKDKNISSSILKEYIKNRLDSSMKEIGFESGFSIDQELLQKSYWMDEDTIGNTSTDFFNKKPVEYAKKNKSFSAEELF